MVKSLKACFSSKSIHWRTPKELYDELNKEFLFDFDPCPFMSDDTTYLLKDWGSNVYCNPPYKVIWHFMNKALIEIKRGNTKVAVFLVPSRTDKDWFHDLVLPNYDEIRLIKGRVRFINEKGKTGNAPFPSCIIVFKAKK